MIKPLKSEQILVKYTLHCIAEFKLQEHTLFGCMCKCGDLQRDLWVHAGTGPILQYMDVKYIQFG